MNRIEARFRQLAERGEKAFVPYITAGDPTLQRTCEVVLALERAGADVIELGVPFSDPVADGPVNQEAAQRALKHNISLRDILVAVQTMRTRTEVPIMLFTYVNPVLAYGISEFAKDAKEAGVDGVLCLDLPPEEAGEYKQEMDAKELATIFLIAPTSTDARMELLAKSSTGFIYYVSRTGVTGERDSVDTSVSGMVSKIKSHSDKPVCVGFGVSKPEHAREIAQYADGVVVGSAIVRMMGQLGDSDAMAPQVGAFVKTLADAAKGR